MKTSYEAEIIKRVDAENKVQGLEETITLNNRMFKEIAETRQATTTVQSKTVSKTSTVKNEFMEFSRNQKIP